MELNKVLFFLLILSMNSYGECINNHDHVNVTGTLSIETFPGPPGFESIKKGDEKTNEIILHVDKISRLHCIKDTDLYDEKIDYKYNDDTWGEYMEIISNSNDDFLRYKKMVGKTVTFSGRVILASSPYHYTQALIYDISQVKEGNVK